ncbi:MAG: hypothetical protein E6Q97_29255 [Desulfurellales bacterium]|nr:MAG: hypothetical protein E6Q97_29255 [Desulfurellales bacterium]
MPKKITDDELLATCEQEIRHTMGYLGGKLSEQRRKAMYYYLGKAQGDLSPPQIDGRSSVVSTDVADTVEWMLPSLVDIFLSSDNTVEFEATHPQYEEQAKLATQYCNHILHKDNPGFVILTTMFKDALLQKNGVVKVWWDRNKEDVREEYDGLTAEQVQALEQDKTVELVEGSTVIDQLTGEQTFNVAVKRTVSTGKVCIEAVPPEEFLISREAKDIQNARMVAHRVLRTISDLRSAGYKNVDNISGEDANAMTNPERMERISYDDDMPLMMTAAVNNEAERLVWVHECYLRADRNGDGIAECLKVVIAGGQILEIEEVEAAPFASVTPIMLPHRFFGRSIADVTMETQRVKTSLIRASLDGVYQSLNGRTYAVDGQVNLDDLLTNRPGGVVRVKQVGAVGALNEGRPDLGAAQSLLEYMETVKENSSGWTRYSQGTSSDSLNQTATGVGIITNRGDMRVKMIARQFAETGVKEMFLLILKLVSQYQDKERMISVAGKWVAMNPREWHNQFNIRINVGLGTGDKQQLVQQLMQVAQMQQQLFQLGIATPDNVFAVTTKITEALGFKQPELFFTNPQNVPPKQPEPNPLVIAEQNKHQYNMAKLEDDRMYRVGELQLRREELEAETTLKREEMTLRYAVAPAVEAQLNSQIYAQQEANIDDGRAEVADGDYPGAAGQGAAGFATVDGGIPDAAGGFDQSMGEQPGAGF